MSTTSTNPPNFPHHTLPQRQRHFPRTNDGAANNQFPSISTPPTIQPQQHFQRLAKPGDGEVADNFSPSSSLSSLFLSQQPSLSPYGNHYHHYQRHYIPPGGWPPRTRTGPDGRKIPPPTAASTRSGDSARSTTLPISVRRRQKTLLASKCL